MWHKWHDAWYAAFVFRRPSFATWGVFRHYLQTDKASACIVARPLRVQEFASLASEISRLFDAKVLVDTTQSIDRVLSARPRLKLVQLSTEFASSLLSRLCSSLAANSGRCRMLCES